MSLKAEKPESSAFPGVEKAMTPADYEAAGLQKLDPAVGPFQAFVAPYDPDVIPHERSDLVPVLGDDDLFVGVPGIAGVPGRHRR